MTDLETDSVDFKITDLSYNLWTYMKKQTNLFKMVSKFFDEQVGVSLIFPFNEWITADIYFRYPISPVNKTI